MSSQNMKYDFYKNTTKDHTEPIQHKLSNFRNENIKNSKNNITVVTKGASSTWERKVSNKILLKNDWASMISKILKVKKWTQNFSVSFIKELQAMFVFFTNMEFDFPQKSSEEQWKKNHNNNLNFSSYKTKKWNPEEVRMTSEVV